MPYNKISEGLHATLNRINALDVELRIVYLFQEFLELV